MSSVSADDPGRLGEKVRKVLQNAVEGWRGHRILWVVSAALLLLTAAYVSRGLRTLVSMDRPATDLHMRYLEQRYVFNGQNPYDVVQRVRAEQFNLPLPECTRDDHIDPEIGKPYHRAGGYPPWSFVTAGPIVLPTPWRITAIYFAFLNVVALAVIFIWAYQIGRPHSLAGGVFLGASAVPFFGNHLALQVGQYGIIVVALLIGVYWLLEKQRPVAGGLLFGLATLKPQVSALFALVFLVRREWRSLAAATGYVVLASVATWVVTRTNPVEMLQQAYAVAQGWVDHPNLSVRELIPVGTSSFSSVLLDLQMDRKLATPLAAIAGLLLAGVLTWLWRYSSTLTLFAIAATTGRLWGYHRPYDDVMLVFLIVPLGKLALTDRSIGTVLAFCLVGLSLWTPNKHIPRPVFQFAQISSWLFGLAILLAWEPRFSRVESQINSEIVGSV